jgi:hypothetical protein
MNVYGEVLHEELSPPSSILQNAEIFEVASKRVLAGTPLNMP